MRLLFATLAVLIGTATPLHAQTIPRAALRFQRDLIANARFVWGLNAPIAVFAAQVHQESGFRPDAQSPYASGLAQFTPGTADDISRKYLDQLGPARPFHPAWALRALALYDRDLYALEPKAATDCERWAFTLSAYNGGRGWVVRQKASAAKAGANQRRWFGHVERFRVRAAWAHLENSAYPRAILLKRQPPYLAWGLGVDCKGVV